MSFIYNDEFKTRLDNIRSTLTSGQVIEIMQSLGVEHYLENDSYIIFPTICHNVDISSASMKLYYYKNTHLFHCYTECNSSFSIYDLLKKFYELHNISYDFISDIYFKILGLSGISIDEEMGQGKYVVQRDKFKVKTVLEPTVYPEWIMNIYYSCPINEWMREGISLNVLRKYNIRFAISQNKIIIPHYNINNELIGIRGRSLNDWEVIQYGKYMPVKIENKWYAHPLSLNLYGLNFAAENIRKKKVAIIFEGEKSVLLYDTYFKDSLSVAVCGNNFTKKQLDLLLQCGVEEIVIAFDKEFESKTSEKGKAYFKKLVALGQKYNQYCKFSFIYDYDNLLDLKDSPIDKGKEIFLTLLQNRTEVPNEI